MKIGITCYPTYGGSGAVATELGLDLADRGHEIHFISYAQPFRLEHSRERIFLHPLGAVEEMAESGISLLKDQEKWTRFSLAARADAVERFSSDRIVPLYEDLYRDVVNGD